MKQNNFKANSKMSNFGWLVLAAMVIGVVYFTTQKPTTGSISGLPTTTILQQSSGCLSTTYQLNIFADYIDYSKTPTVPTQVSTVYNVVPQSGTSFSTFSLSAGSTSATQATVVSNGIGCGGTYMVYTGDGTATYYENSTVVTFGTGSQKTVSLLNPKYAAATLLFTNSISTAATVNTIVRSVGSGQTVTAALMQIQAGQYVFGQQFVVAEFVYNSAAITGINIQGAPQYNVGALPAVSFLSSNTNLAGFIKLGAQTSTIAFQLPSVYSYQYDGQSPSFSQQYINPIITTGSSYAINEPIGVYVYPSTCWFNTSRGTNDCGVFVNGVTKAGLFAAVGTTNGIVLQNN